MKLHTTLLAALALAPGALAQDAVTLRFAPADGTLLSREFSQEHALTLESLEYRTGTTRRNAHQLFELKSALTYRCTDQMLSVADGRPQKFRRYYDGAKLEVQAELSMGQQQTRDFFVEATDRLLDHSVVFTWVPEDREYGRYYDTMEGPEERLPLLGEDLDLRALLPAEPVAAGATWSVPAESLRDLFAPGGAIPLEYSKSDDYFLSRSLRLGVAGQLAEPLRDRMEGECDATFQGTREEGGTRVGVIALAFDVTGGADLVGIANFNRTPIEASMGVVIDAAPLEVSLKGEAEVLWDLEGNHLHSYSLGADERVSSVISSHADGGEGEERAESSQHLVMVGRFQLKGAVTREKQRD